MEGKHMVMSAVGIGIGVGVGLGLASAPWAGGGSGGPARAGVTLERVEQELRRLVVDGKDSKVTFDEFPYYLSEQTRVVLTSAAYVHLKQAEISKYTRNLAPASRAILLSGPAELYQQMLAKALAHYFEAKILLLDPTDFLIKILPSLFLIALLLRTVHFFSTTNTAAPLRRASSWTFDEKILVQALYKVLHSVSKKTPIVLYIRDVEKFLHKSPKMYLLFEKLLTKLEGPVLLLGSRIVDMDFDDEDELDDRLSALFPYNIDIKPPENENRLGGGGLSHALEIFQENKMCDKDTMKLEKHTDASKIAEKGIAPSAAKLETKPATLLPPAAPAAAAPAPPESKTEPKKAENPPPPAKAPDVPPDNEFEKRIRPEVIPANEIGVSFEDIGALDDIKESLQELVMLPLRRPDLFKGGLLKPCRGILLFGPPGTGKTMLAKAIANEAQASFINVSMSTITSKWFGEDEKNVRALFTLAAKVSPTIIFVDEVDSMLGQRNRAGEHEAMRKIKNEFMTHWDGLLSRSDQKILVLAATNRPFDLDEAIIRRFERRIMVGLPSAQNREMIMRNLLSKEKVDQGLDFKEIATMTEGYSGSDLKNLCTTAAYRPVRELIQKERKKELEKKKLEQGGTPLDPSKIKEKEKEIVLRPLNMKDLKEAKNQVAASFAAEGSIMGELKQWNELYGEGGSRKKEQLTYFL
ncbi:hypothetical protein ACQ4PT_019291 [Festuca glaucescens]